MITFIRFVMSALLIWHICSHIAAMWQLHNDIRLFIIRVIKRTKKLC